MFSPLERFKSAWNAFLGKEERNTIYYGGGYSYRPDKTRRRIQNERSIVNLVYNKIAVDCSSIDIKHVRLKDDSYANTINSSLNRVLTKEANIDQTGRALIRDLVYSLLDEGCVALVPVDTSINPNRTDSYDILSARVGRIVEWYPANVKVEVYNERTGRKEQIVLEKRFVPIIENPFYSIMNEPNSTLQRLLRVWSQLDKMNDQLSSGKMDMIIQLPYVIKTEARIKQAEERRNAIEQQLTNSKYGIAYIDGTEKVTQLNRSLENNLWVQAKELKDDLLSQMGLSLDVFNGTADEKVMINYYSYTIEPILTAVVEEIERKWLSRTAQTQGQAIRFFRDPFKLIPVAQIAEISDKFTRNEIMTSNEIRSKIGLPPFDDPKADMLINSNLNQSPEAIEGKKKNEEVIEDVEEFSSDEQQ